MVQQGQIPIQEAPPSSLRERVQIAERSGDGRVLWDTGSGNFQRLWDHVDGSLSQPIDTSTGFFTQMLRKVVFKCSECVEASPVEGNVDRHIQRVRAAFESHKDAEIITQVGVGVEPAQVCSGCGNRFVMRKKQAERHLERMQREGPEHVKAYEITMLRFSLEPPVSRPASVNGAGIEPEGLQVERRQRGRRRKRQRSRRR